MKYTLQWTDQNGKCWHLKKAIGASRLNFWVRKITATARVAKKHATLITIVESQAHNTPLPDASGPVQVHLSCPKTGQKGGL